MGGEDGAEMNGLLACLAHGIEYADRPQHSWVHRYVYRRNLAHMVADKALGPASRARPEALEALQGMLHQVLGIALWCKRLVPKEELCAADAGLDLNARYALDRLDRLLLLQQGV